MNSRNIIFSFCVCVVLCLCLGHNVVRAVGGLSDDSARSYLEGRTYQTFPELAVGTLADGSFQSKFEQYIADLIPMRDDVMLLNAGLQRTTIALADAPFGFSAYPTFFGSDYLCCPADSAVVETPSTQRALSAAALEKAAGLFAAAIGRHDNVRWQFALVDRSRSSHANPAHDLVAQPADYQFCVREFLDKLPESCGKPDLSVADADEYFQLFYRTDHHWKIGGALVAYGAILEGFGFEPDADYQISSQFEGPFYGANDRGGLSAEFSDSVDDVSIVPSIQKVMTNGKERELSWLNERFGDGYAGYKKAHRLCKLLPRR
ncbi:MAG: hypothetical protein IJI68_04045 [Eggerthellaceae bacterium]|nr:hypothetical protein [Eggerthellaceae bacterium]